MELSLNKGTVIIVDYNIRVEFSLSKTRSKLKTRGSPRKQKEWVVKKLKLVYTKEYEEILKCISEYKR